MELDKLKEMAREVKAPHFVRGETAGAPGGAEALLQAIRQNDERECKRVRKALPFFLVAAALFALICLLFMLGPAPISTARAAHYGTLALVFMVVGSLSIKKLHDARELDYSAPVRTFLQQTENRYRFFGLPELCYSIPLLAALAVTGGFFIVDAFVPRYFGESQIQPLLVAYGLFFLSVCGMGFFFTYKNWKRDKGVIRAEVRRMRQALESQADWHDEKSK
jgi:hypothetical protein